MSDRAFFTLSGGLKLSYLTWGEPGAPDLLLLHGGGLDATDWREVAPELAAAGYRVTAPDLRGCGESDWDPDAHYGVEDTLTDIDELLEHLGSSRSFWSDTRWVQSPLASTRPGIPLGSWPA